MPEGTGRGAGSYVSRFKVFAKTGTSNNSNDLWFVGGTPHYVASCWAGYDQPQNITRSSIALNMWGAVMLEVHRGLEDKTFTDSSYVKCKLYCKETGLIATDKCPVGGYGWYKTSDNGVCTKHNGEEISADSKDEVDNYLNGGSTSSSQTSSTTSQTSSQTGSSTTSTNQTSSNTTTSTPVTSTENSSSEPELGEGEPVTDPISIVG